MSVGKVTYALDSTPEHFSKERKERDEYATIHH